MNEIQIDPADNEAPASIFMTGLILPFLGMGLFFALVYEVGDLALFSLILLFTAAAARLWARAAPDRVLCAIEPFPKKLFPDDRLDIRVRADNAKFLPVLLKLNLPVPHTDPYEEDRAWIRMSAGLLGHGRVEFGQNRASRQAGGV